MPRLLITGASGYLGMHLLDALTQLTPPPHITASFGGLESFVSDYGTVAADCVQTDLGDSAAVAALMKAAQPDVVVHLGAISSPAVCEQSPERCLAVNCPMALLEALPPTAAVIFLSTDQVYDGLSPPYVEGSATAPVNAYGRSKLAFEQALAARLPDRSVSLRSSLILGGRTRAHCRKATFLQFCDERLRLDEPTTFFRDEIRSAVSVEDIVAVLLFFIGGAVRTSPGVYNMGGPQPLSRVQLARAVAEARGLPAERIADVARASLPVNPGAARSPPDISMDSSRLRAVSGIEMRTLDQMLATAFTEPEAATCAARARE
jgi:dTDP-4-dehydrorhamnose reductase